MTRGTRTFVGLTELSNTLGIPKRWLRDEARADRLPHLRVGNRYLFNPATVERELLSRAGESAEAGGDPRD